MRGTRHGALMRLVTFTAPSGSLDFCHGPGMANRGGRPRQGRHPAQSGPHESRSRTGARRRRWRPPRPGRDECARTRPGTPCGRVSPLGACPQFSVRAVEDLLCCALRRLVSSSGCGSANRVANGRSREHPPLVLVAPPPNSHTSALAGAIWWLCGRIGRTDVRARSARRIAGLLALLVGALLIACSGASARTAALSPSRVASRDPGLRLAQNTIVVTGDGATVHGVRHRANFVAALGP